MSLYVLVTQELNETKYIEHSTHRKVIQTHMINFMEENFCFEGCTALDIMSLSMGLTEDMFAWTARINAFLEMRVHSTFRFKLAISTNLDA